jgi:type VI secretion system protein
MLHSLGQLTRELANGLTRAMRKRREMENKLRIPATVSQSSPHNPLNSDADVEKVLRSLVSALGPAELTAADAAREAFVDLEIHQLAMLSAMHMAVMDLLEQFDPRELEKSFERQWKRNSFIGSSSKRRYWEMYRDAYDSLARRAPGKLPEAFIGEFAQSYEEEAARILDERHANDTVRVRELVLPDAKSG